MVLWGTDNMKSEGTPLATALALIGAVPRFDAVGRLCGARLVPLEQLGRRAVDRLAEQISGSGPVGSAPTAADPVLAVTLTVRGSTAPYAAGRT